MNIGHSEPRVTVNWIAGLRAIGIAFCLGGMSSAPHGALILCVALAIAGYGLIVPLQLGHAVFSRGFVKLATRCAILGVGLGLAAYVLSFAVNSSLAPLALVGNALFLGLLAAVVVAVLLAAQRKLAKWVPAAAKSAVGTLAKARSQLDLISLYFSYPAR